MLEERYGSVTPLESQDRNNYANTLIPDLCLQNHGRLNFCCPKLQFIVLFYNSPWNLIYTHSSISCPGCKGSRGVDRGPRKRMFPLAQHEEDKTLSYYCIWHLFICLPPKSGTYFPPGFALGNIYRLY